MRNSDFLIGAATAAHQVEGNNTNSDIWAMEQMKYGGYPEKSLVAADHYNRYKEDISLLKQAGLNAYRFSFEWARIEPSEGIFDEREMQHYLDMVHFCKENKIEPVITLHHFSSPKWLIEKGGWESEKVIDAFVNYTRYVAKNLSNEDIKYICTINEANMGNLISIYIRQAMEQREKQNEEQTSIQIGLNIEEMKREQEEKVRENLEVFGVEEPAVFVSPRSPKGNQIIMDAHRAAVDVIHKMLPDTKVGLSLSLRDVQCVEGGEERAEKDWHDEFEEFLPAIIDDDFLGVQNYTRTRFGSEGELTPEEGAELTQMGYEFYPEGLPNVIRRVHTAFKGDILVTENGIATDDDTRRVEFIKRAFAGVRDCINDGIPVKGYMYWSLLDNFEWQSGYSMRFGLIGVDRQTRERSVRPSLQFLGEQKLTDYRKKNFAVAAMANGR
ncbi:glycoside hydrolase family 1 protein [Butyrivibrio sp. FC2001]|uniref:glycoside hydrolase family 1 protein n=1 Tax=Butyrivibrio sp. FC2001 TaxID=1280671 RepID=UPI0003F6C1CA|nr:family 1 glycosylhydrolase [Butyrivibrio sp. FC2001]